MVYQGHSCPQTCNFSGVIMFCSIYCSIIFLFLSVLEKRERERVMGNKELKEKVRKNKKTRKESKWMEWVSACHCISLLALKF